MADRVLMSPPDVGQVEEEYVLQAMRSGWVAPTGPDVTAFENEIADRVGVGHAVALSSGTAALHLGMLGLGVGPGDVVIVPTMTFVASANAVTYTGARPCFVDVSPDDGNMDPQVLRDAISYVQAEGHHVAAVMSVDIFGVCANNTAIAKVCADAGVPLIEDAAEALGATDETGQAAGSFGRVAALSFNGNKIMTTSGGGMLVSNDKELADHARFLSTQAREPVLHYEHKHIGYNYRMSNILAALGRGQLSRLDSMIARRREIREIYHSLFDPLPGIRLFGAEQEQTANCWLSSVVVDREVAGFSASELGEFLNGRNIECRPLWKPMHLQPTFADSLRYVTGAAQGLFESGLTLPSGSAHDDAVINGVTETIREFMAAGA
ncbi:aminotransferase class I/II-fold pyridoxal phosphate-dependent enzyme [Arthrobacter castelli]|uniref:aminotransferase class I/II-fold pyridoxal phosphate-dependent enzyme n=1 Tax=Arthrobacter castelli TaxID=271431 RepID=UPI00040A5B27|nr:aminotransferase class I/II-fold pyridoxal phosphate-dependent enzyme [Arthrobacter castelli]